MIDGVTLQGCSYILLGALQLQLLRLTAVDVRAQLSTLVHDLPFSPRHSDIEAEILGSCFSATPHPSHLHSAFHGYIYVVFHRRCELTLPTY